MVCCGNVLDFRYMAYIVGNSIKAIKDFLLSDRHDLDIFCTDLDSDRQMGCVLENLVDREKNGTWVRFQAGCIESM